MSKSNVNRRSKSMSRSKSRFNPRSESKTPSVANTSFDVFGTCLNDLDLVKEYDQLRQTWTGDENMTAEWNAKVLELCPSIETISLEEFMTKWYFDTEDPPLGCGSYGCVYIACWRKSGDCQYVVKKTSSQKFGGDVAIAAIAGAIGIGPRIFDAYLSEYDDLLFVVMERLQGRELRPILEEMVIKSVLKWPEMLNSYDAQFRAPRHSYDLQFRAAQQWTNLWTALKQQIDRMHKYNINHNDLRDQNIFVINPYSDHPIIHIIDFGEASITFSPIKLERDEPFYPIPLSHAQYRASLKI